MIKNPMSLAALGLAFAVALTASVSLGAGSSASVVEDTVKIDNFTFNPPRLVVATGPTVTWINEDDIPHTVTSVTKLS